MACENITKALLEDVIEITWVFDELIQTGQIRSWDDMIDEFNSIQAALVAQKGQKGSKALSKLTPEELEAKRAKAAKRLAALEALLNG